MRQCYECLCSYLQRYKKGEWFIYEIYSKKYLLVIIIDLHMYVCMFTSVKLLIHLGNLSYCFLFYIIWLAKLLVFLGDILREISVERF